MGSGDKSQEHGKKPGQGAQHGQQQGGQHGQQQDRGGYGQSGQQGHQGQRENDERKQAGR